MEGFSNADYMHTKRVGKDFEMKHLGEYRDLYVSSNTLFLAYMLENFWNMPLKEYKLDPVRFLTELGLA